MDWSRLDEFITMFPSMEAIPFNRIRVMIVTNYSAEYLYTREFCPEYGDIFAVDAFERRCAREGIFFWNTLYLKHMSFKELTEEIVQRLVPERAIFCLLDKTAVELCDAFIDHSYCPVIYTKPRLFSTINDHLNYLCKPIIEWRSVYL